MEKLTADVLLLNGYLMTMDGRGSLYPEGGLAISQGLILAAGPSAEIESARSYASEVQHDQWVESRYTARLPSWHPARNS